MPVDLDLLMRRHAGGSHKVVRQSLDELVESPWGPALKSRYFVQAEADVSILRRLIPRLSGLNVGLGANVDALRSAAKRELLEQAVDAGVPIYLDSGVVPRALNRRPRPQWDEVFKVYEWWVGRSSSADLLTLTAPDALVVRGGELVGDMAVTEQLQRRYQGRILGLISAGVRMVVPIQGKTRSDLFRQIGQVWLERFPGSWMGIPMRTRNTTPLHPLVTALLELGLGSTSSGGAASLPALHILGMGSGERVATEAARIQSLYRVLSGPHVYRAIRARQDIRGGALDALMRRMDGSMGVSTVAEWLSTASLSDLERLAGCVQTRAFFPCPPGERYTFPGSHPVVDKLLRDTWRRVVGRRDPLSLVDDPVFSGVVRRGRDDWTVKITGVSGLVVQWVPFYEIAGGDWTEACLGAIEEAEEADPAMVPGAWDAGDLSRLVKDGGLDRFQSDSTSVSIAAKNGRWIVDGRQRRNTPDWWKSETRAYRFVWNLRAILSNRLARERQLTYHFPTGYDANGFL